MFGSSFFFNWRAIWKHILIFLFSEMAEGPSDSATICCSPLSASATRAAWAVCAEISQRLMQEKVRIEQRMSELDRKMGGHRHRYPRVSPKFRNPTLGGLYR